MNMEKKKKLTICVIMTFLICIFAVGCGEKEGNRDFTNQTRFDEEVSVSDGISRPENRKDTLQIEEDETYTASRGLEYLAGVVCGMIVAFLLLALLAWMIRKMGGKVDTRWWKCGEKNSYDERQIIARGQAYKTAFFVLIFYIVVVSWMYEMFGISLFMSFAGLWMGVYLSLLVFAVICIWKDAYMTLYENAKGIIILFGIIGGVNIVIGILGIASGNPILKNGALSVNCINLVGGILLILILIAFVAKLIYNEKNARREEDE